MSSGLSKLGELKKGQKGNIVSVGGAGEQKGKMDLEELVQRLMEMGLLEGAQVEIVHEAPFGRDPIAVRVRGSLVALRRAEANHILVEVEGA